MGQAGALSPEEGGVKVNLRWEERSVLRQRDEVDASDAMMPSPAIDTATLPSRRRSSAAAFSFLPLPHARRHWTRATRSSFLCSPTTAEVDRR